MMCGIPVSRYFATITVVLFAIWTRHQHLDVLPQHVLRGIAEQPFCRRIECLDDPFAVDDDDAVDSRLENGLQDGFHMAWNLI